MEEIRQHQPAVIVAVGAIPLVALYKRVPLTSIMGQILEGPFGVPLIATYHPAFLLRGNWNKGDLVITHLEKALRVSRGELHLQTLAEAKANWLACTTVEEVEALREYLLSDDVYVIALDTETTGLSWMDDELLCISFSALDKKMRAVCMGFTVPILHVGESGELENYWLDAQPRVIDILRDILGSDKLKAIQNAGFDIPVLERERHSKALKPHLKTAYGFEVKNLAYDPMLLQRLVNENLPANETVMLALYTDLPYYEEEIKGVTLSKKHMEKAPDNLLWTYASGDADGLARLVERLYRMAREQGVLWVHDNISIPMIRATWNMTRRGMPVDMDYFARLCDRYDQLVSEASAAVYVAAGFEFNLNKPQDIQDALFVKLGLPVSGRKTEKAKECKACQEDECEIHNATGKEALKDIQAEIERRGEEPNPVLDALLHWKEVSKRKSTYVNGKTGDKGMLRFIRGDNCIHPHFTVNRAATGRLSASEPNVQNIPKRVVDEVLETKDQMRRTFIAPRGYTLMEMDWSQGEVWVMAYESGDETLMKLLKEGLDVHTYVARTLAGMDISRVFPKDIVQPDMEEWEWKKTYDEYRRHGKVFVFGLDYGMTAMGVAERLHCSIEDAQRLVDAFLTQVFPSLQAHFDRVRRQMQDYGYLEDRFGRRGHFNEYSLTRTAGQKGSAYWEGRFRTGVNMPVQAGLSDLHQIVQPALEADEAIASRYAIINAVHDSTMGLVKGNPGDLDKMLQTAWMIKEKAETTATGLILPNGDPLGWEIPVEIQWGNSWGELKWTLGADGNFKEPEDAK